MKQNIQYINTARAIGIILIILGHCGFPLTNFIYLFHVPLFFFISGYLFKTEYVNNFNLFFKRIIKRLYIPFITINLFFLIVHNLFTNFGVYNNYYNLADYIRGVIDIITLKPSESLMGASWFVGCLIFTEIIYCIIRKLFNSEKIIFIISLVLFFISITLSKANVNIPRNVDSAMVMVFVYNLGVVYKMYENRVKYNLKLFLSGCAFIIVNLLIFKPKVNIVQDVYPNIIVFILGVIVGIYLVIYVSKLIDKIINKHLNGVINILSKNTLLIMYSHFTVFKLIDIIFDTNVGAFPYGINNFWIIYTVSAIIIPISVKYIYLALKQKIFIYNKVVSTDK